MSSIQFRLLETIEDFECAVDLEIAVWDLNARDAVPSSLSHALTHGGGMLAGAFDDQQLVGLVLGFPARRNGSWIIWSHMAAVHPAYQGRGIGLGLKQFQRQWALDEGYAVMSWTFDPLQARNANFNLAYLGAVANTYHINFYGEMTDGINMGLPSDRLEVVWKLKDQRVKKLVNGKPRLASTVPSENVLLEMRADAQPLKHGIDLSDHASYIEIPADLTRLKQISADLALEWRLALRDALQTAFAQGYSAVDVVSSGGRFWYVLQQERPWFLYVLECADSSLYTGIALDVEQRLKQHNSGRGAAYTRAHRPVRLLAAWRFPDRGTALRAEAAFKGYTRQQKIQLIEKREAFREGIYL